jgi:hypothetical protein
MSFGFNPSHLFFKYISLFIRLKLLDLSFFFLEVWYIDNIHRYLITLYLITINVQQVDKVYIRQNFVITFNCKQSSVL